MCKIVVVLLSLFALLSAEVVSLRRSRPIQVDGYLIEWNSLTAKHILNIDFDAVSTENGIEGYFKRVLPTDSSECISISFAKHNEVLRLDESTSESKIFTKVVDTLNGEKTIVAEWQLPQTDTLELSILSYNKDTLKQITLLKDQPELSFISGINLLKLIFIIITLPLYILLYFRHRLLSKSIKIRSRSDNKQ